MKPLTIEELKALEVGDWVWEDKSKVYEFVKDKTDEFLLILVDGILDRHYYSDYGKTWLAYKNKEQAECKGEIVEIKEPVIKPWDSTKEYGFSISFPRIVEDVEYYYTREEAERRLAELKGEK